MPLSVNIESGGEKWRDVAMDKLRQMKEFMAANRLPVLTRWFQPNSTDRIMVNSCLGMDRIRVIAGGLRYYALAAMPDPTPYRSLFLNSGSVIGLPPLSILGTGSAVGAGSFVSLVRFVSGTTTYGTIVGSETATVDDMGTPSDASDDRLVDTMVNFWNGGGGVITGLLVTQNDVVLSNTRVVTSLFSTATYAAAFAAWSADNDAYIASQGPQLLVNLSDSTVLASVAQSGDPLSPTWVSLVWDGTSSVMTTAGSVTFTVPPDVGSQGLVAAEAVAREKLRLQTNSATALGLLSAGELVNRPYVIERFSAGWDREVKLYAPVSARPRFLTTFSVVVGSDETVGPDVIAADPPETLTTRTVQHTASYVDADGVTQQETITGTRRINSFDQYAVYTFNNWPEYRVTPATPLGFRNGGIPAQQGTILNGPFLDGNGLDVGALLTGTRISSVSFSNSQLGTPTNPITGVLPGITSLSVTTVPLYLQYLRSVRPVDVNTLPDPKPAYSSNWLSTSMVAGEVVTLIPFSPVKDDEDLGMFGPTTDAQKVAVYGKAKFRYNLDGSFTFVSWQESSAIVAMTDDAGPIAWPAMNCLIEYSAFPWADVRTTAKTQAVQLKAPTTQSLRFIKLVKDAAGL